MPKIPPKNNPISPKVPPRRTPPKPIPQKKKKKLFFPIFILSITIFLIALGSFYLNYIYSGLPSLEQLENPKTELATKVYSIDGEVIDQFYLKNRTFTQIEKFPQHLLNALIATEDKDFYEHWGVTPWRFIRALIKNVFSFSLKEGASTITQQLSRNLYNFKTVNESAFDKMTRKFREFITAVQIEKSFTKSEIIEMYLNIIYFGRSAYGITAASSIYFGKDVENLNLSESSLLVGMAKGPSYYDPIRHLERALGRREIVLSQMVKYGYISNEERISISNEKLNFTIGSSNLPVGIAPHFIEHVRQQLLEKSEELGFDLFRDGLSIYTTLDLKIQRHLNRATEEQLDELQKMVDSTWNWKGNSEILEDGIKKIISSNPFYIAGNKFQRDSISKSLRSDKYFIDSVKKILQTVQVGVVVLNPENGNILAMVGGADFKTFKYGLNHVTQVRRQPGSSFKPFIYTVAIDNGYSPSFTLSNQPVVITGGDGKRWAPSNVDNSVGGEFTIREALRESINLVAVHAILEIAPKEEVVKYAKQMGITSPILAVESIALGTPEITPLEMTSAFSTFANEGIHVEPISILKILDKNNTVIEEYEINDKEVLSKETAFLMTSMMEDVVNRGTGTRVRNYFNYPAAGKTGTTNDFSDAWFVGYTPQFAAGVWLGFDDHRIKFQTSDGQGGRAAAPLWGKIMGYIYDDVEIKITKDYFSRPEGIKEIILCLDSKKKATTNCLVKFTEIYNSKYPIDDCGIHSSGEDSKQSLF